MTNTPQADPVTKAQQELEQQKEQELTKQAIAEAKQKTAEAERATLLATLPKSDIKGLEGSTEVDDKFGYGATIAAYEAMERSVTEIATKILADLAKVTNARVLFVSELVFAPGDLARLQVNAVMVSTRTLLVAQKARNAGALKTAQAKARERQATTAMLGEPLVASPLILQSLISSAAELASYFQSNYSVKGQAFDLNRDALVNALSDAIKALNPRIFNFNLLESSNTMREFAELLQLKQELIASQQALKAMAAGPRKDRVVVELTPGKGRGAQPDIWRSDADHSDEANASDSKINASDPQLPDRSEPIPDAAKDHTMDLKTRETESQYPDIEAMIRDATKADDMDTKTSGAESQLPSRSDVMRDVDAADKETTSLIDAFDAFVKNVTASANQTDLPPLTQAALHEYIREQHISHLLWVKPISSGGEAVTQKQLFRSGHVSYVGGGVISYVLAQTDGAIVSSGTKLALSQISRVLSTNRDFRLKQANLTKADKNILEKLADWLNI
jgi:hypothetical protein